MATSTRIMSDKQAMDALAYWMDENDPTLDGYVPEWVWDLVTLIDELVDETGRKEYEDA